MTSFRKLTSRFLSALGVVALLSHAGPAVSAAASPFDRLHGAWTGGGTISLSDGSNERLRCRANYSVGDAGYSLKQTLRCASDSYKFDLDSNAISQGNIVSGTWSESSRGISGSLQGRAIGSRVAVIVEAAGFAANLTLTTNGGSQSVSINSQGEIKNVSLELRRR